MTDLSEAFTKSPTSLTADDVREIVKHFRISYQSSSNVTRVTAKTDKARKAVAKQTVNISDEMLQAISTVPLGDILGD